MKPIILLALALATPAFAADSAPAAAAKTDKAYPLDTCVVSGEALDSMGAPFVYTYKEEGKPDREIRFCCKSCVKKFNKEPAKYIAKLDAAAKAADPKPAAPAADAHAGHNH